MQMLVRWGLKFEENINGDNNLVEVFGRQLPKETLLFRDPRTRNRIEEFANDKLDWTHHLKGILYSLASFKL